MANFMIVGGAGYIGSHVVKLLVEKGHDVIVIDDLSTGHRKAVEPGARFWCMNAKNAVIPNDIDCVMYFGAHSIVSESVIDPKKYYSNNFINTFLFINNLLDKGINKFIFSSTAAVYGNSLGVIPITESSPTQPINTYGETKLMVENMLQRFDKAYGLKYISLRYFNAAGADPSGLIGEDHKLETHLIPNVLNVALGKKDHVEIYGNDYSTHDGTCIRDYIHVNDLAEAHILAAWKLFDGGSSGVYNLGSGLGSSVKEIIELSRIITKHPIPIIESPRRDGDPSYLLASSELIKTELDWKIKFGLEKTIHTAWNWHKLNPDGFKD